MVNKLGRDFWVFRFGQFFSDLGSGAFGIAIPWWVLEVTGSVKNMSILIVSGLVIKLVAGLLFAPIADRFSRKKLIVYANLGSIFCMASISLLLYKDALSIPILIFFSCLGALFWALFDVSHNAFVSNIVEKEDLPNALGQIQIVGAVAAVIGGVFGAGLVTLIGIANTVMFNGVTFLLALMCTAMVRNYVFVERDTIDGGRYLKSFVDDFLFGFMSLIKFNVVFRIIVFFSFVMFFLSPLQVLMPYVINIELGLSPIYLGGVVSAAGFGSIVGGIFLGALRSKLKDSEIFIVSFIVIGICFSLISLVQSYSAVFFGFFFVNVFSVFVSVIVGAKLLLAVPDEVRSRVDSIVTLFVGLSTSLGVLLSGGLLEYFDPWLFVGGMGFFIFLLIPFWVLGVNFSEFLNQRPENIEDWLEQLYRPGVEEVSGKVQIGGDGCER